MSKRVKLKGDEPPKSPLFTRREALQLRRSNEIGSVTPKLHHVGGSSDPLQSHEVSALTLSNTNGDYSPAVPALFGDVQRQQREAPVPVQSRAPVQCHLSFDGVLFSLCENPPEEFATQLTLLDWPLFKAIGKEELLSCKWTAKNKLQAAPNIVAFTRRFNQTTYWVIEQIVEKAAVKQRVEVLAFFIRLAKKLFELRNISSMVAVMSALQSTPVYRLKQTWAELARKKEHQTFLELETVVSEEDNRQNLRTLMNSLKLPCIPHLGIFLTDLTYLSAANQSVLSGVRDKMIKIVSVISTWQSRDFDLDVIPHIRDYLSSLEYIDELTKFLEDDLYKTSLRIEPVESCPSISPASPPMARLSCAKGHRRAQSYDSFIANHFYPKKPSTSSSDGLFHLSVIDTEAGPGPRNLIDDSLMRESSVEDLTKDLTVLRKPVDPVVGMNVQQEFSDCSDRECDGLLEDDDEVVDDLSDSDDKSQPDVSMVTATKTGTLKRKTQRRGYERPSFSKVRMWRKFTVAICGKYLVFYHDLAHKRKARCRPVQVVDLDECIVDQHVLRNKPNRFQLRDSLSGKHYIFKAESQDEAAEWIQALNQAKDDKQVTPESLMTFDEERESSKQ